jgi:hypothetical protein
MPAALHATTGFPLDAPHAGLECTDCHAEFGAETGGDARFARAFPGRGRRECEACHADPHAGQFDRGSAGTRCIECHRDDAFVPSGFDRARHGTTRFPLEAAHAAVACADCHGDAPDQRFAGTPLACAACHDDPHAGQFADGRHGASCLACHGPDAFVPSRFDVARHERTRFALTGAHAAVGCAACHGSGSAPGLTPVYADAPRECADCHDDPHGGRFDREGLPRVVGDRAGCARCHTTESFRLSADDVAGAADAFDHGRWTGYELVGAHAAAACADCHVPGPAGAALGRTLGPVSGTHCADCHVDPHLGQFDARGGTDCARCHAPASADFSATRFDHAHDARFAPGERHRDVACASCHQAYDLSGGSTVVRYRPLGTRCADCHEPGSVDE